MTPTTKKPRSAALYELAMRMAAEGMKNARELTPDAISANHQKAAEILARIHARIAAKTSGSAK